ncbi:MAG: proton-conducting transporter membrane subunit, partial [Candidatus Onthomonas sp.]
MNVLTLLLILLPLLAGPAVCQWGRRGSTVRTGVIAVLALELGLALLLTRHTGETLFLPELCGLGISFSASGLQIWLCLLAGFLWLVSGLFSGRYLERDGKQHRYYMFLLLTEGAIMGVFLSADLFTTLVFFEMMSFASYPLVIHRETKEALRAGASYLTYAVLGGMISLMGLFLLWNLLGTLRFAELPA